MSFSVGHYYQTAPSAFERGEARRRAGPPSLSDVSEGGGTVFNRKVNATALALHGGKSLQELVADSDAAAAFKKRKQPWEEDLVKACHTHFSLRPKSGDAILFYSQSGGGGVDPLSWHGGAAAAGLGKWTVQCFATLPESVRGDEARTRAFLSAHRIGRDGDGDVT